MAIKLKKPIVEHIYFDSKINKEKEVFEIMESSIGFSHQDFANRINDCLQEIGIEIHELSASTYIPKHRMAQLLKGQTKFEYSEIKSISKRLNF